jgi:uncharacterized membrane protein YfcA
LSPNQAITMGILVGFVGYASSSPAYCYGHLVAYHVAWPSLAVTVPVAVAFSLVASPAPARWLLVGFGGILFFLAALIPGCGAATAVRRSPAEGRSRSGMRCANT